MNFGSNNGNANGLNVGSNNGNLNGNNIGIGNGNKNGLNEGNDNGNDNGNNDNSPWLSFKKRHILYIKIIIFRIINMDLFA